MECEVFSRQSMTLSDQYEEFFTIEKTYDRSMQKGPCKPLLCHSACTCECQIFELEDANIFMRWMRFRVSEVDL